MKHKQVQRQLFFGTVVTVVILCFCGSAMAMSWDFNNGMALDCDVTVGYAAGLRVEDRDSEFLASQVNKDDGSQNFDQWSLINNRFSVIADIDFNYNDAFGLFVRPRAFYDTVYMGSNDNDSPGTNNNFVAGAIDETDEFADEVEEAHGNKAEVLDAFIYTGFEVGDGRFVDLRLGRQVVQWGESYFILGGIASAMAHLDITAASAPGTEVKEVLLPTGAASLQMDLTDSIAVGAFYQWEWEKHRLNESGSFLSDDDFMDEAGNTVLYDHPVYGVIPLMSRGEDQLPDEQGQYGFSAMYRAGWLAETEFGLYFLNYHEKLPVFNTDVAGGTYHLSYGEDIRLYGISFGTLVGSTNISGEVSLRQDFPMVTTAGVEKADYWQAQTSWMTSYAGVPGVDRLGFYGEVGCNQVLELSDEDLSAQGKDAFAWGYTVVVVPEWYQVLPNLDMSVSIAYKGHPDGISVNTLTFDEKDDSGSIGINFTYKSAFKGSLKYVHYIDSMEGSLPDRDYVAFNLKYTF